MPPSPPPPPLPIHLTPPCPPRVSPPHFFFLQASASVQRAVAAVLRAAEAARREDFLRGEELLAMSAERPSKRSLLPSFSPEKVGRDRRLCLRPLVVLYNPVFIPA